MAKREMFQLSSSFVLSIIFFSLLLTEAHAAESTKSPQFVLVPGIGHGAWAFSQVITLLEDEGYSAVSVDLASQGISKLHASDIGTIEEYVKPLDDLFTTTINKPVILLGHSLAGGPISVMMEKFPQKIAKAVFLAAIMPTNNQTFFSSMPSTVLARSLKDNILIPSGDPPTSLTINVSAIATYLYNRSPRMAVTLASTLLNPTPYRPGDEPILLTPENYGSIRRYFIRTGSDLSILRDEQTQIIRANPPEKIYSLPHSDHSAYFSDPITLSKILLDIAKRPY